MDNLAIREMNDKWAAIYNKAAQTSCQMGNQSGDMAYVKSFSLKTSLVNNHVGVWMRRAYFWTLTYPEW